MLATRMRYSSGFGGGPPLAAAVATLITSNKQGGNLSSRNFGTVAIGAADAARKVAVCLSIGDNDAASAGVVNSVTLGGNAMTKVVNAGNADLDVSIWVIDEHTAATTATLTMVGSATHVHAIYAVFRVLSFDAVPQSDSGATVVANGTANAAFTVPDDSAVVMIAGSATGDGDSAAPFTWSGDITADEWLQGNGSGEDGEGAKKNFVTGELFSTTVTFNAASQNSGAVCAANWAKV